MRKFKAWLQREWGWLLFGTLLAGVLVHTLLISTPYPV